MATLAKDTPRVYETNIPQMLADLPMVATDTIFEGAALGEATTTGTYRPLVGGDTFGGFARQQIVNAGAASIENVKSIRNGVIKLSVTGVSSAASMDAPVYATDDNTFTLTASGGTAIGKISKWIIGTTSLVTFQAASVQSL